MAANTFYCMTCNGRKKGDDIRSVKIKNKKVRGGVPAKKGHCHSCGGKVVKFVKR